MGEELGSFGYSVRKQEKGAKAGRKTSKSAEKGAKAGRKTSKSAEKAGGAGKVRKSADVNGGKKAAPRQDSQSKAKGQSTGILRKEKKRQK